MRNQYSKISRQNFQSRPMWLLFEIPIFAAWIGIIVAGVFISFFLATVLCVSSVVNEYFTRVRDHTFILNKF